MDNDDVMKFNMLRNEDFFFLSVWIKGGYIFILIFFFLRIHEIND
jgi:hypothetical protein